MSTYVINPFRANVNGCGESIPRRMSTAMRRSQANVNRYDESISRQMSTDVINLFHSNRQDVMNPSTANVNGCEESIPRWMSTEVTIHSGANVDRCDESLPQRMSTYVMIHPRRMSRRCDESPPRRMSTYGMIHSGRMSTDLLRRMSTDVSNPFHSKCQDMINPSTANVIRCYQSVRERISEVTNPFQLIPFGNRSCSCT